MADPAPAGQQAPPPSLAQVLVLQSALAELRGHPVAGSLAALGALAPDALHRQILTSRLDLREVMAKLAGALPPDRGAAALAAFDAAAGAGAAALPPLPLPRAPSHSASPAPPPLAASAAAAAPPLEVESIEDMARRIKPGTMKRTMFEVLVDRSDAGGMSVGEIYEELERRGQVAGWPDVKAARSAISSACSADGGMVRLRQGVFALRARVPREALEKLLGAGGAGGRHSAGGSDGGGGGGGGGGSVAAAAAAAAGPITVQRTAAARRTPTVVPAAAAGPRPLPSASAAPPGAEPRLGGFDRNEHACVSCRAPYHPSFTPLVLCDYCPRAFHLACLNLDWEDLPGGEWACPVCLQQHPNAAAFAQQRQLLEEGERRRAKLAGAREAAARMQQEAAALAKLVAGRGGRAGGGGGGGGGGGPADDLDVAEEEAAEAARLGQLVVALREQAERERGGGGGWQPRTAGEQLREAQSRLARLKAASSGPPEFEPAVESEAATASLLDVLAISEFLAAFGPVLGAPVLDARALSEAAAWPADGEGELVAVYTALLRFLLAQWSQAVGGHIATRVKRWARCLERCTGGGTQEGLADGRCSASWQEVLRRYCLLSRSAHQVTDSLLSDRQWSLLDDDLIMVHAAVEAGRGSILKLGPQFHVRLVGALVNEVAASFALRGEVNKRLESTIQQQISQYHANAERRKAEREAARLRREAKRQRQQAAAAAAAAAHAKAAAAAAAAAGAAGGGEGGPKREAGDAMELDAPPAKRPRSRSASAAPGGGGGGGAEHGDEGDEDEEDEDSRAAVAARLAEQGRTSIRSEPLGSDRLHRRYWLLPTFCGGIFQEGPDGRSLSLITRREQLDALMKALNPRGPREGALLGVLRRRYDELAAGLCPPQQPLDVAVAPRPAAAEEAGGRAEPYPKVLADAELESVRSCVGELEAAVTSLMGVGVPGASTKGWRRRLAATTTTDQLAESVAELERELHRLGEGLPAGADDAALEAVAAEAGAFESEFVLPVTEAELAAARAAAAAAAEEEEEEAAAKEAEEGEAAAREAAAAKAKASKKGGKKGGGGGAKGKKGGGGAKGKGAAAAAAESEFGPDDEGGHQMGPSKAKLLGKGRVRRRQAGAGGVKAEAGGGGGGEEATLKLVAPLEELDDSDIEAEERYRIKRQHEKAGEPVPPPLIRLWRTPRERGVWLRDVRRALIDAAPGGVAYCAAALADRASRIARDWPMAMKPYWWMLAEDRAAAVRRRRAALVGLMTVREEEWAQWEEEAREWAPVKPKKPTHFEVLELEAGRGQRTAAKRLKELLEAEEAGDDDDGDGGDDGGAAARPSRGGSRSAAGGGGGGGGGAVSGSRRRAKGRQSARAARGRRGAAAVSDDEPSGGGEDGGGGDGDGVGGSEGEGEGEGEVFALPAGPIGSLPEDERFRHLCLACEMTGDMMACEVPGCCAAMHPECAGFSLDLDAEWRCPDHAAAPPPAWLHAVCAPATAPGPKAPLGRAARPPPVRRFVL
ncbi:hypothetical protein Rsub_11308 [Raphidocelis subcapitata]|uniref:PHD-type domain-containing protein n=1 Tax=Raphidocelis subcapitata TaxID=307507 RepID=A0A2V0PKP7_9CHLO|nr:hypothetical protein Rsub_11308 [Raphidocelis subcapitata]|eukprot:GBF98583.1 hypothetical protein Rsub_11308 [Raphidocelis subcapitata]